MSLMLEQLDSLDVLLDHTMNDQQLLSHHGAPIGKQSRTSTRCNVGQWIAHHGIVRGFGNNLGQNMQAL